ncbi:hypothetical protein ACFLRG_00655 [Bacteroidota bacterium]
MKAVIKDNFLYTQSIDVKDFDNDGDMDSLASPYDFVTYDH